MIRCADCKHFRELKKSGNYSEYVCTAKGTRYLDENLVYKYSKFMCDFYSPLPGKEMEAFKKEN